MEAIIWHSKSQIPLVHILLPANVHLIESLGCCFAFVFVFVTSSILGPQGDCCCLLQWRFCSFRFAGLVPPHTPSACRCGGWQNESTHCSSSGSGCWTGQPPALLHPQNHGELISTDPASSPFVASKREPSNFSYSHVLGFNLPTPIPRALLC